MNRAELIIGIHQIAQQDLGLNETCKALVQHIAKFVPYESATLFLYEAGTDSLKILYQDGSEPVDLAHDIPFGPGQGLSGWTAQRKTPLILGALPKSRVGRERFFSSFLALPLWIGEKLIGVLNLGHSVANTYSAEEVENYTAIGTLLSMALEQVLLRSKVNLGPAIVQESGASEVTGKKQVDYANILRSEFQPSLKNILDLAEILEFAFETGNRERVIKGLRGILAEAKHLQKVLDILLPA